MEVGLLVMGRALGDEGLQGRSSARGRARIGQRCLWAEFRCLWELQLLRG